MADHCHNGDNAPPHRPRLAYARPKHVAMELVASDESSRNFPGTTITIEEKQNWEYVWILILWFDSLDNFGN